MFESKRALKFIIRNSPNFSNTRRHIENSCECYSIKDYKFTEFIEDQLALIVRMNGTQYIAYLDHDSLEVKVSTGGNVARIFSGDSGWNQAVRYLSEQAG